MLPSDVTHSANESRNTRNIRNTINILPRCLCCFCYGARNNVFSASCAMNPRLLHKVINHAFIVLDELIFLCHTSFYATPKHHPILDVFSKSIDRRKGWKFTWKHQEAGCKNEDFMQHRRHFLRSQIRDILRTPTKPAVIRRKILTRSTVGFRPFYRTSAGTAPPL